MEKSAAFFLSTNIAYYTYEKVQRKWQKTVKNMTYSKDEETLWACNSKEEKICVKKGTKRIGPYAFNCADAREIVLPDSLIEIATHDARL